MNEIFKKKKWNSAFVDNKHSHPLNTRVGWFLLVEFIFEIYKSFIYIPTPRLINPLDFYTFPQPSSPLTLDERVEKKKKTRLKN